MRAAGGSREFPWDDEIYGSFSGGGVGLAGGFHSIACDSVGVPSSCLGALIRQEENVKHVKHALASSISLSRALCFTSCVFFYVRFHEEEGFYVLKNNCSFKDSQFSW